MAAYADHLSAAVKKGRSALMGSVLRRVPTILTAALLLTACGTDAEPPSRQAGPILVIDLTRSDESVCMVDSEFSVGGVQIEASEQDVIDRLGPPLSRRSDPNLLDIWVDAQLRYDGLLIDLSQDRVVGFEPMDPRWRTPSGMYVGMPESELRQLFGVPIDPVTDFGGEVFYQVYFCSFDEPRDLGSFFNISIDTDRTVSGLLIGTDTP